MYGDSYPVTAKVTVEFKNADGSTTIMHTNELDAGGMSLGNRDSEPSHIVVGTRFPLEDRFFDPRVARRSIKPGTEFFYLDMQLPLSENGRENPEYGVRGIIYQFEHIEKPTNRMFFRVYRSITPWDDRTTIIIQTRTEEEVAKLAEEYPEIIYFVAEVPE